MGDQPTPAPQGDAAAAPQANGAVTPAAFIPYIAQPGLAGGFNAMTIGALPGGGILPPTQIVGTDTTTGPKARADVPGAGPVAANPFALPAAGSSEALATVAANPELKTTALDTSKPSTTSTDKAAELSKPQLTFSSKEADKANAHLLIDKNGDFSFNKDKPLTKADEKASVYVDPTLKDTAKISAAIDKANVELAKQGIQLQKPADMATALKNIQAEQAKSETEKAKTNHDKKPSKPENGGGKKPVPDGGGGGGGGGGCNVPDKKDRNQTDRNKNGGHNKLDASSLPKSFEKSSQFVSDHGGMNNGSYANFINAVYGGIPGYGGMMSQFADIDNDPNLSPEEKAAKKAELMKKFQEEHKGEIAKNTENYRKELSDFGDKDSVANFDSIAKNLTDSSKAGNIVNMLSQKEKASSTDINAVFDSKAQKSLTNLALIESQGADWKSKSKDKAEAEKIAAAQAEAAAAVVASPFTFRRK